MLYRVTLSASPSCKHNNCTATSPTCAIVLYHLAFGCCDVIRYKVVSIPTLHPFLPKTCPDAISQGHCCFFLGLAPPNTVVIYLWKCKWACAFSFFPDSRIIISPALTHTVLQRYVCPWETRYFPNTHNCISGAKAGNSNLMSESLGSQKVILRTGQIWTGPRVKPAPGAKTRKTLEQTVLMICSLANRKWCLTGEGCISSYILYLLRYIHYRWSSTY